MADAPTPSPSRDPAPPCHRRFAFTHRVIEDGILRLGYRLEDSPSGPDVSFEERLTLPAGLAVGSAELACPALARALEGLHLACGTSYWKAAAPAEIRFDAPALPGTLQDALPDAEAALWTSVWTHGLGEYFYKNGMSPRDRIRIPGGAAARGPATPERRCDGPPLLLVGGGKDSVVSAELLRAGGVTPTLFCVGRSPWIERSAASIGGTLLVMERSIAPELLELNAAGALNGHVPISAILSFAARIVALLSGASAIIASNERSASVGNTVAGGVEINHQWSKGLAFERLMRDWEERNMPAGPRYFSLLRPLSELAIGRLFARAPKHFENVTSCNRNFKLAPDPSTPRWCLSCPKCVFVFLMLAPWLADDDLARVFGGNPLEDAGNLPLLEELAGLARIKPFECVGEPDEVIAALWLLHRDGRFGATPALALARERIIPSLVEPERLVERVLAPSREHLIPPPFDEVLSAAL